MGNNAAFTSFEASVIAVYNRGVLDEELLKAIAMPYAGMDIDRGGMEGTLTKDGLDIDGVILKVHGIDIPSHPKVPDHWKDWTEEQVSAIESWDDLVRDAVRGIEKGWGW